jgi:hypothetical protein
MKRAQLYVKIRNLKKGVISQLRTLHPDRIGGVSSFSSAFQLDGKPVLLCIGQFRRTQRSGKPRWLLKLQNLDRHCLALICTIKEDHSGIRDLFLKKEIGTCWNRQYMVLKDGHWWLDAAIRLRELGEFFAYAQQLRDSSAEAVSQANNRKNMGRSYRPVPSKAFLPG